VSLIEASVEDHVATVTLNRSEALNAISGAVADELAGTLIQAAADPEIRVVVLGAAGDRAFCVGADLKERNRLDDAGWLRNRLLMRAMFDSLRSMPQPTVASVFGFALGGGFELALCCDLVVAAEDAVFGLPEVGVGILPGGGGTQVLARKVGVARAKDLVLTSRRIDAAEAAAMGLVARVAPRAGLAEATRTLATELARAAPLSAREAKRAIDRGFGLALDDALELEDLAWRRAVATEDRTEGIAAFNEKRDPVWKGR
jgi:enoyl-CoA hydratase/carnithine racemase